MEITQIIVLNRDLNDYRIYRIRPHNARIISLLVITPLITETIAEFTVITVQTSISVAGRA